MIVTSLSFLIAPLLVAGWLLQVPIIALSQSALPEAEPLEARGLPELRIVVTDSGLELPAQVVIRDTELTLYNRRVTFEELEATPGLQVSESQGVKLRLVRAPGSGAIEPARVTPTSGGAVVVTDSSILSPEDYLTPDVLITLVNQSERDIQLQLAKLPDAVTIDQARATITSGDSQAAWLDDAFYPGLPVMPPTGNAANVVVKLPFEFPVFATYVLFAPGQPDLFAAFQAVIELSDPAPTPTPPPVDCEDGFYWEPSTSQCEMVLAGSPPPPPARDVNAEITMQALNVSWPIPLGYQVWAITNAVPEPRPLVVYRVADDTNEDQVLALLANDEHATPVVEESVLEPMGGISQFSGDEEVMIMLKLGPGTYVAVSPSGGNGGAAGPTVFAFFRLDV